MKRAATRDSDALETYLERSLVDDDTAARRMLDAGIPNHVVRDDDTQRLRLMLDQGGWLAFSSYANANPTLDRLATLLSLAADAGIVQAGELDGERAYSPGWTDGRFREGAPTV